MSKLHESLKGKADEFARVRKIGRTHLQDAVPMSLGQEFSGYARQVEWGVHRIRAAEEALSELALGGTAVGTGLNTHPEFASRVIAHIAEETGCSFKKALNHFEAQGAQDGAVQASGVLKTFAVSLIKIANDIRWLSSGPRCGLGEINIPSLQPGSSIMPGKVNPVIPEAVIQVAAQVIGNDASITFSGQGGYFELNAMLPVIAHNLLQSIHLLSSATTALAEKCVNGISANTERSASYLEQSLAIATAMVPVLGYDKAAVIAKEAYEKQKTVREIALEKQVLPEEELNRLLDEMVHGGK
jgi:fumarate hydratase class II